MMVKEKDLRKVFYNDIWQGWQFWNQTFDEDSGVFDVEEIREVLDEGIISSMIKAIIFDADGPLYYRTPEVDQRKRLLLAEFGFTGEFKQFQDAHEREKFKGYTRAETIAKMFQNILRVLGLHPSLEEADRFAKRFDTIHQQVTAVPDAAPTLKQLRSDGYKICILTDSFFSAKDKWPWFRQMGMDAYLDDIVSSYDIRKLKDTSEAYQACLERLNVGTSEAIFVGHQEYEMLGALAAHIASVAVMSIATLGINADYKIDALSELPGLLKQINSSK